MTGLTNGFTTPEENYCAVVGFLVKLYPWVVNVEGQKGIIQIAQEMVSIYPTIFTLEFIEGLPTILLVPEGARKC